MNEEHWKLKLRQDAINEFGHVPNSFEEMLVAPAVAELYLRGQKILMNSSLSDAERQVIQLAVSEDNECSYCIAAHRFRAKELGIFGDEIDLISQASESEIDHLRIFVDVVKLINKKRGQIKINDLKRFEADGITRKKVYEIIAYIGLKTISNYINNIAEPKIDQAWL